MQKQTVKSTRKAVVVERVRLPAAEAMANRGRMSIGKAFIRDVIEGKQRDWDKQLSLAIAMGLGTRAKLAKMDQKELREKLGATLASMKGKKAAEIPASITVEGEVLTVH